MFRLLIVLLTLMSIFIDNSFSDSNHKQFFDTSDLNAKEMRCYGLAMIGFDSVINSRSGILPQDAFPRLKDKNVELSDEDIIIAKIVYNAFSWQGSPHTYAIKIYGNCVSH